MCASGTVIAGSGEFRPNDEISIGTRVVTRKGANRVAREAFEIARTRPRKTVASVHKEPVYRLVCGMFAEECRKVAKEYPDCKLTEVLVDGFAMKLLMNPQQYDVVVTTNQFGDILTDEGAGLVGGLGLAPGLCAGEKYAMAQATRPRPRINRLRRQTLIARSRATCIGMPTPSTHGPRGIACRTYIRRTPSTPSCALDSSPAQVASALV